MEDLAGQEKDGGCSIIEAELQGSLQDGTHLLSEFLQRVLVQRCSPSSVLSAAPPSGVERPPHVIFRPPAPPPGPGPGPVPGGTTNHTSAPGPAPTSSSTGEPPAPGESLLSGLLRGLAAAVVAFALEMCADFCVHLGLAARAIWWMIVGVALLVAASFGWTLWCCFLRPIARLTWRSVRYLTGLAPPPNLLATGEAASDVVWHGPGTAIPWGREYLSKAVKARGTRGYPMIFSLLTALRESEIRWHASVMGRSGAG